MPWKEADAMELRVEFIRDWLKKTHSVSDLCALYGVSRKTAYKWVADYVGRDRNDFPKWIGSSPSSG